jgi:putative transposase
MPVRQAMERDEAAIEIWKSEVWPQIRVPPATWAPTSASRTRQGKG